MSELLSNSETLVFETHFKVRFHEVDALGHVNNAVYLNYLEQAAIDHGTMVGLNLQQLRDVGGVFVAHRHEIIFARPAFVGDFLRVVTWIGMPRGARVTRNSWIVCETDVQLEATCTGRIIEAGQLSTGGETVVRAVTDWAFVNNRGQPCRIPPGVIARFYSSPWDRGEKAEA